MKITTRLAGYLSRSTLFPLAMAAALAAAGHAQTTTLLSHPSGGGDCDGNSRNVVISADGTRAAFGSTATNLVPGDSNVADDVFVLDRLTGATVRASVDSNGDEGHGGSFAPSLSRDGRFVAFHSFAKDLDAADTNECADVFVRDLVLGTTVRASVDSTGAQGHGDSLFASISADGRFVAFQSVAPDLVAGDGNGHPDVFVRDLQAGVTYLVSISTNGAIGDAGSFAPSISADGRLVVFDSDAQNLVDGDGNQASDVFVRDLELGLTTRESFSSSDVEGDAGSLAGSISADGRYVVFYSQATNLVPYDANQSFDVFRRDRVLETTMRISVSPVGRGGNADSFTPAISADGRYVAFQSAASNLEPGDGNMTADVFVRDVDGEKTWRLSVGQSGAESNGFSGGPSIAADGRLVAFYSDASNLVLGDGNAFLDAYLADRETVGTDPSTPYCFGDGSGGHCPCENYGWAGRGCANSESAAGARFRAAGSTAANLVTGTDTVVLSIDGLPAGTLALALQGTNSIGPHRFGDGLRCTGGVQRLVTLTVDADGEAVYPQVGDLSLSQRSASIGDPIAGSGATRYYQVVYRDGDAGFCPDPAGGTIDITNGLSLVW